MRTTPGYPTPESGFDSLTVNIYRPTPYLAGQVNKDDPIEKLFSEIEEIFKKREIKESWQWALIDFPAISITLEINGKKISLTSSHPYMGNKYYSSWQGHTKKQPHQEKLAFDEIYAAIKRYVDARMLVQRE